MSSSNNINYLQQKFKAYSKQFADSFNYSIIVVSDNGAKTELYTHERNIENITSDLKTYIKVTPEVRYIVAQSYREGQKKPFDTYKIDLKKEQPNIQIPVQPQQYNGLGEAEINSMINAKVEAIEHQKEYNRLKEENTELKKEIEKHLDDYNQLVDDYNELEKQKKEFKFSGLDLAELAGQALQNIVVSKPGVLKKLGLSETAINGIVEELSKDDEQKQLAEHDESGIIVEENPKNKCIETIKNFLYTLEPEKLQKVNDILFEIQNNDAVLNELHVFLQMLIKKLNILQQQQQSKTQ